MPNEEKSYKVVFDGMAGDTNIDLLVTFREFNFLLEKDLVKIQGKKIRSELLKELVEKKVVP